MKIPVVLMVAMLALANARTRERRQTSDGASGCFWWEDRPDCQPPSNADAVNQTTTEPPPPPPKENVRANVGNDAGSGTPPRTGLDSQGTICNNGIGRCVSYYLCKEGNIITDGAGLIDIRVGQAGDPVSSSGCPAFLEVCCNAPEPEIIPIDPEPVHQQCGVRNEQGVHTRIQGFGNNEAQFGEHTWMAAILRKEYIDEKELNLYVCGGSLIHPAVILTAAHCVASKAPESLKVRLGEWDTQRTQYELYPHVDRNVRHVVVHENFNNLALLNDFALLFLDNPVELAPHINTICLPAQGKTFDYDTCWATGWGRDEFGKEGNYQNVLKEVSVPVVPNDQCQAAFRTTRLGGHFVLHHSFICAGGEQGQDTCKGDGGSPLVCPVLSTSGTTVYVQAGIVAWGIGCGEDGIPGVYADVAGASDWIIYNAEAGLLNLYNLQTKDYWKNY